MNLLILAGSLRKGSYNKKLAKAAIEIASSAGLAVTFVDIADYPMLPFNGDDEKADGLPKEAKELKKLLIASDAMLIASPEYNSSVSGTLKNIIDWTSRPEEGEPVSVYAYRGKAAAIMSASPGALGGMRGLIHLRAILGNIGMFLAPSQVCLGKAHEAFNEDGSFKDSKQKEKLESLIQELLCTTKATTTKP